MGQALVSRRHPLLGDSGRTGHYRSLLAVAGPADKRAPDGRSVIVKAVHGGPQDYDAIVAAQAAGLTEVGAELSEVIAKEATGLKTP